MEVHCHELGDGKNGENAKMENGDVSHKLITPLSTSKHESKT